MVSTLKIKSAAAPHEIALVGDKESEVQIRKYHDRLTFENRRREEYIEAVVSQNAAPLQRLQDVIKVIETRFLKEGERLTERSIEKIGFFLAQQYDNNIAHVELSAKN